MESGAAYRGRVDMGDIEAARKAVAARAVSLPATGSAAARERPAPPRVAAPPKTVVIPSKAPPRLVAPGTERPAVAPPAAPPSFPRVAGTLGSTAPAWAKKKVRRR
jgi:hypothetical protein